MSNHAPVEDVQIHQLASPVPTRSALSRRRKILFVLGLSLALAIAAGAYAFLAGDDGSDVGRAGGDHFSIAYPKSWRPLSDKELGGGAKRPVAGLRRQDGTGFLFVREAGRAPQNLNQFTGDLSRELRARVPDFRRRSARIVKIAGGRAFFFSYIRSRRGTVHSVVVLPAGSRSYTVNTVSRGGSQDSAREIAQMILSFKAKN